jgi:hypothetical protein
VTPDSLYVVGADASLGVFNNRLRLERRDPWDGAPIYEFQPWYRMNGISGMNVVSATATDATSIYLVGFSWSPTYGSLHWRIEKRRLSDWSLVTGFGTSGVVMSYLGYYHNEPSAVAISGDSLYIVGQQVVGLAPYDSRWLIERRRLSDGAL